MMKFVPALALMIVAGPAFAQSGATQSPPSPLAGKSAPQTSNSLPPGAANMNTNSVQNPHLAGQAVGGTVTGGASTGNGTTPVPQSR